VRLEIERMTAKKIIVALALIVSTTAMALAQSQRNCGPSGPAQGNCFGQPYSGTIAARCICYHHSRHWR
jgi:hypothetical protein